MRRWLMTIGIVALCVGRVGADVTITTTLEGPMMALAGGNVSPKVVTRIKGNKSRTDVEMGDQTTAMLIDLSTKQAILLNHGQKTAQLIGPSAGAAPPSIAGAKFDTTVKATGKKREIGGHQCDEFTVAMKMDMSSMAAGTKSDAAVMLKGVRMTMTGFVWVAKEAPGSSEYQAFQTNAAKLAIAALSAGGAGTMPSGMEQLLTGFAEAPGIPYLTELMLGIEGTGPVVDMMKQMSGQMKVISRVASVSIDTLQDALFRVPDDYKMIKQ